MTRKDLEAVSDILRRWHAGIPDSPMRTEHYLRLVRITASSLDAHTHNFDRMKFLKGLNLDPDILEKATPEAPKSPSQ